MDAPWVFAYGSLMWRPGFAFEEERPALLRGWRRSLCVFSHVHRGVPERPGLVLGLDRGGACRGAAYRIADQRWSETLDYLRGREQATDVYVEMRRAVTIVVDGKRRSMQALFYAVDRKHPQYAGRLPLDEQVRLVMQGVGVSGANPDYVLSTVAHLKRMGVRDPDLETLAERIKSAQALASA